MKELFSILPTTLTAWIALLLIGVLGFFALYDRVYRARNKRSDELDTELIKKLERNLEDTQKELTHVHNNQLQKKSLDVEIERARDIETRKKDEKLAQMQGQYDTVTAILQGRNKDMDIVVSQAPSIFATAIESNKITKETNELVKSLVEGQTALSNSVKEFVEIMKLK